MKWTMVHEPRGDAELGLGNASQSTGCSEAWLSRYTGGVEIAGSNPVSPTNVRSPVEFGGASLSFNVHYAHGF